MTDKNLPEKEKDKRMFRNFLKSLMLYDSSNL